jgi:putative ABC transport system substrate-binding protein
MRRRDFMRILGGAAAAWPLAARAQQAAMPVVAVINGGTGSPYLTTFARGLGESGYVDGQNISVEYHWLAGQFDHIPALMTELVRRRVAVIATPASIAGTLAAKAATTSIPIVFGVNDNPVKLGLVASLARPGGNLTGVNFFSQEAVPKRLQLLHEVVPKAKHAAILINPSNSAASETALLEAQEAARVLGLPMDVFKAGTSKEIESALATMAQQGVEVLFIAGDAFFSSRFVQFATLATRYGIATSYSDRQFAEVGGLMSYSSDLAQMWHQIGSYTGQILKGARPADLPVVQSTKFEFIINLQTARAIGIEVPPAVMVVADELIE